jgi:hypothetical protein
LQAPVRGADRGSLDMVNEFRQNEGTLGAGSRGHASSMR